MSGALTGRMGSFYLQFTAGKRPEYFGCLDLGTIAENMGASDLIQCRDVNGDVITVGATDKAPTAVKTDFTALVMPEADVLDQLGKCRVNLYAQQSSCGKLGVFTNYDRWQLVHHAKVMDQSWDNLVMRVDDKETTRKYSVEAYTPVYRGTRLSISRQSIAESAPLNAIAFCNAEICEGDCGPYMPPCTAGYIGTEAPTGSPAAYADTWNTSDGGANWILNTGGGAHPFGAGFDITAAVCFQLDRTTMRRVVFSGVQAGQPLHSAYSDDDGATWTIVHIGAVSGEYVVGAKAVKAFDSAHIWVATSAGNVYYSDDGGTSYTDQNADTASGGLQLNAIDFSDYDNGYAVGNTGTIINTTDGMTWGTDASDPSGGDNLTALNVFSRYRLTVGTNADGLFQSWDAGATWDTDTFTGQTGTGTVALLEFANDYCGFMVTHPASGQDYVHITHDGGYYWERLATPPNAGLNDLYVCDCDEAFAVGEPQGGTGVVLHVSA